MQNNQVYFYAFNHLFCFVHRPRRLGTYRICRPQSRYWPDSDTNGNIANVGTVYRCIPLTAMSDLRKPVYLSYLIVRNQCHLTVGKDIHSFVLIILLHFWGGGYNLLNLCDNGADDVHFASFSIHFFSNSFFVLLEFFFFFLVIDQVISTGFDFYQKLWWFFVTVPSARCSGIILGIKICKIESATIRRRAMGLPSVEEFLERRSEESTPNIIERGLYRALIQGSGVSSCRSREACGDEDATFMWQSTYQPVMTDCMNRQVNITPWQKKFEIKAKVQKITFVRMWNVYFELSKNKVEEKVREKKFCQLERQKYWSISVDGSIGIVEQW